MRRSKFSHFCLILHNATPTHIHQLLTHIPHTLLLTISGYSLLRHQSYQYTHKHKHAYLLMHRPSNLFYYLGLLPTPQRITPHRHAPNTIPAILPNKTASPFRPRVGSYLTRPRLLTKKNPPSNPTTRGRKYLDTLTSLLVRT